MTQLPTAALSLVLSIGAFFSASSLQGQVPPHLDAAIVLLEQITSRQAAGIYNDANGVSLNRYGGSWSSSTDPSYIRFGDLDNGILPGNNTKCSPLVTHLLKTVYGWNWKNYSFVDPLTLEVKSVSSPTPYQYIALIKEGKGFAQRVTNLAAVQPGDILNWWQPGTDASDHTMIVAAVNWASAKAYPLGLPNSNPALGGTTYVEVRVIDSSSSVHTADSRLVNVNGTVTQISGIGTGVIGILINQAGEIVGSTWSLPTSSYDTQKNTWVKSLNSRLKLAPTWEFGVGRMPAQP